MAGIFGKTISDLTSVMNYRIFRQGIISGNVANADTPGYTAKDVAFEKELESRMSLSVTDSRHIDTSVPGQEAYTVRTDPFSRVGNDANTVDIDREMMKLSQNQILYSASADIIQSKLEALKNAIRGIQ